MRKCLLLVFALALSVSALLAQQEVRFGQHRVVPEQNVVRTRGATENALAAIAQTNGRVNVLMQFSQVPDAAALRRLEQAGVVLEGYVGGNAYFAQVAPGRKPSDFARYGATSVIGMRPEWKVSSLLEAGRVPQWADKGNGRVEVVVSWFSNVDGAFVKSYAAKKGYEVNSLGEQLSSAVVTMPLSAVRAVAAEAWVRRVRPIDPPQELSNNFGRVLSGGSYLSVPAALGGRGLTGKGVRVGLWDGNVERHVDFGDRLHVLEFEMSVAASGGHGIHTAGTIAGAGLLNPKARGLAPEAELYTMNFNTQSNGKSAQEEMLEVYKKYNIALTSNSYGFLLSRLCNFYNILSYSALGEAYMIDMLSRFYPEMTHVYAGGNDQGSCDHDYGSSAERAKNVIYVGAVNANGGMSDFSSWGPMDDGRLLPTVSAKGVSTLSTVGSNSYGEMSGTSMACPTVSGLVTLLTERYHQLHGGKHMNSALVKGILANTADDKGNEGPDYQYGYGIVNGAAAVKVIENGWYHSDVLVSGTAAKPFTIKVPAGVKQLRVMLTWIDAVVDKEYPYGLPALINDLDLSVSVGGTTTLPWVLDKNNPSQPATRGVDTLNNIEQVVIDNPTGDATVMIGGQYKIHDGAEQGYVLTWYFDYGAPELLHPVGGELFAPGESVLLRANNLVGETKAEISYDGGKSYTYVGKIGKFYSTMLTLPKDAKATQEGKIRLSDAEGHVLVNEYPFTIAGEPQNLAYTAEQCSIGSWMLKWDAVEGATEYAVMKADVPTGHWKEISAVKTTEFSIPEDQIDVGGRNVYAVAVKFADGAYGPRSQGVLVEEPTPIVLKELPYRETFVTLPLKGATIKGGENINIRYAETPASVHFPLGSRLVQATVKKKSTKKVFEDPDNIFTLKICKLDLRGVKGSKKLLFHCWAILDKASDGESSQLRLKADGTPVKLTTGVEAYKGTGDLADLYWDLTPFADKEMQLELEYSSVEQYQSIILIQYGLQEAYDEPEVGVFVSSNAVAAKPNMGKEDMPVLVYSGSEKEVKSVPVVVLRDGKVAASMIVKDLMPYEERGITIPVDFKTDAPEGQIFKVEVKAEVEGDQYPEDNSATTEVYNMGNVYVHPESEYFLGFSIDPKKEVSVDGEIVYADMGGLLKGYTAGQKATVWFKPKDKRNVIQVTFNDWELDGKDSLSIYAAGLAVPFNYSKDKPTIALRGKSKGKPVTVFSSAKDGGVFVNFNSVATSDGAAGWKATVRELRPTNYFTLLPIAVEEHYPDGEATIKIKVKNLTPVAQTHVKGEMLVEGIAQPIAFEIPKIEANAESEFTIPTKVEVPVPSLLTVTVKVLGADTDLSDNEQSVTIRNDKFWYGGQTSDTKKQGLKSASVWPSSVKFPNVGERANVLTYHLEKELVFYTETKNPLRVQLQTLPKETDLPATLHVWIDLDESDNALKNEAPEYYSVALEKGKRDYEIQVDLTGQKAGKRRLRLAVLPGGETERGKFIAKEELAWGCAMDITADIREGKNPSANDLALKSFVKIASGANLSKEQELKVTIVNNGYTAASNFEVTVSVNGVESFKETVTETIEPFGGSKVYTFTKKVDLSAAKQEYVITLQLPDDDVKENNVVEQQVLSLPGQAKDKLYALDFKRVKGESINYSASKWLTSLNKSGTIEGWFYLRGSQSATLFNSSGLLVVATHGLSGVPDNALAVLCGRNQLDLTKENSLMPGQFHHIAITYSVSSFLWLYSTKVTVYIDGVAVEMEPTLGEDRISLAGLLQAPALDGQVKMVRYWNKPLQVNEIKSQMSKSVRKSDGSLPSGCVAEYFMNEGAFGYIASGDSPAKIVSKRIDAADSNIWVDISKELITGVKFDKQILRSKVEDDGTISFIMPHDFSATTKIKGKVNTIWPGTNVEYSGATVDENTEFDFSGPNNEITLKASVTAFDIAIQQEVKVRLIVDKSPEAKVVKLSLLAADNANLKQDVRVQNPDQTIVLKGVEDAAPDKQFDVSKSKLTLEEISAGAKVVYNGADLKQGDKFDADLTHPVLLMVQAENERTKSYYSVQITKSQTVQWGTDNLEYTFTAQTVPMDATSSSGVPVEYRSENENVVTIDGKGLLHTSGVGETRLIAAAPAKGLYERAASVSRKVTVTPAKLNVAPKALEMEEGDAMPSVELAFDGLLFGEKENSFRPITYAVYKADGTQWEESDGPLAVGEYNVKPVDYTGPYTDGNYSVTLADGKLKVKPSSTNKRVTFTVTDDAGGAALAGATVEVGDATLTTSADGKVSIVLAPGVYGYTVALTDYASFGGEVKVEAADQDVAVALKKLQVTVTYVANGNGDISGKKVQHLPSGGDAEQVVAVADDGYMFEKWDDNSTDPVRQDKAVAQDVTYTAQFRQQFYQLKYTVSDGGEFVSAVSTQSQSVPKGATGTEVEVRAKAGYHFLGWSDGVKTLKRTDKVSADLTVEAQFYKPFPLMFVENFEGSEALPFGWSVENYSTEILHNLWQVGNATYTTGDGRCAYVDDYNVMPDETNTGLLTPWIDLSTLTPGSNLQVAFKILLSTTYSFIKAAIEYRTEEGGNWTELKKWPSKVMPAKEEVLKLENAALAGKTEVQFRWIYVTESDYGIAIDNVTIGVEGKEQIYYVAGKGGKVTQNVSDPNAAKEEIIVETTLGTLGAKVTAVADDGYEFDKWDDNTLTPERQDSKSARYTALFRHKPVVYTLTYLSEDNGRIDGLNYQPNVAQGADGSPVVAVGNEGYHFVKWSDDGTQNPRVDRAVMANVSVTASFAVNFYTLTYAADANGVIEGQASQQVEHGKDGSEVKAVAKPGYHFTEWSDGVTDNPRTDKAVKDDIDVTAEFAVNVYSLTYTAGANGKILGVASQQVEHGQNGMPVEAVANEGYHFVKWSDGVTMNIRADKTVQADINVTAEFEKDVTTATLTFVVQDVQGKSVQGATVTVNGKTQQTDAQGEAKFADLPFGEYSYAVSKEGFKTAQGKVTLAVDSKPVIVRLQQATPVESVVLSQVALHPNPASAVLVVENTADVVSLSVVTLRGELLLLHENVEGKATVRIAVDSLPEGMYLLVVEGDGASRTIPFAVTK